MPFEHWEVLLWAKAEGRTESSWEPALAAGFTAQPASSNLKMALYNLLFQSEVPMKVSIHTKNLHELINREL